MQNDTNEARMTRANETDTIALMTELQEAISNATPIAKKMSLAEDTLNCWWAGQTDDGRKRGGRNAKEPWPWEGASDTRVRVVQEKCNEVYALLNQAYKKGNWKFSGVDGLDFVKAHKMTQFLKWQVKTQMGRSDDRQRKLATKWMIAHGYSVMSVGWDKIERIGLIDVTAIDIADKFGIADIWQRYSGKIEELQSMLANNAERLPEELRGKIEKFFDLYTMLSAPTNGISNPEKTLSQWLKYFYEDANESACAKAAKNLREKQTARIPQKRIVKDCPTWQAFLPFYNIFFPVETADLESSRWIAVRKWYSRTEVEAKEDWPKEFRKQLLKHEGESSTTAFDTIRSTSSRWKTNAKVSEFVRTIEHKGLFEVFEFFYKAYDETLGAECLKRTVFSEHVKDGDGKYFAAEDGIYDEGCEYPFILFEENPDSDYIVDNCGLPFLLYTHQQEIKDARDGRIDAKDINLLPPVRRNIRDQGRPFAIGPDRPVYESVQGSTEWMSTPNSKTYMAVEVENVVKRDVDRFVGAPNAEVPKEVISLLQGDRIENYTELMSQLLSTTFKLDQLYMTEAVVTRVSGILSEPFKVSREEIQGSYDFFITFDRREMDEEFAIKKAEQLVKIMNLDANGIIDRNKAVSLGMTLIDPDWAEQLITDASKGAMREIGDEQDKLALILTGQEPPMREEASAKMRLQYLENAVQKSPEVQRKLQSNPFCAELFQNRVKHLQFMVQQQQNAQIGRLGVSPVMQ